MSFKINPPEIAQRTPAFV